jgi:hypothetical protein
MNYACSRQLSELESIYARSTACCARWMSAAASYVKRESWEVGLVLCFALPFPAQLPLLLLATILTLRRNFDTRVLA